MTAVPTPTPIYRLMHVDNLEACLRRQALCAPNHTPEDGYPYRTIHNAEIQTKRRHRAIPCGPGGSIHDYVSFYLGTHSPMLLQLHTGRVAGYAEGQEPLLYLIASAQEVHAAGLGFVFSDGHGIAAFTQWFDDLPDLRRVDWGMVRAKYWADTVTDPDRQRRKQAEFLVHRQCPWSLIQEVGVLNQDMQARVESMLALPGMPAPCRVAVRRNWYY